MTVAVDFELELHNTQGATINLIPCPSCSERFILKDETKHCDFCKKDRRIKFERQSLALAAA